MVSPHVGSYGPSGAFGQAGVVIGSQTLAQTIGGAQLVTIQHIVEGDAEGGFGPAVHVSTRLQPTDLTSHVLAQGTNLPYATSASSAAIDEPTPLYPAIDAVSFSQDAGRRDADPIATGSDNSLRVNDAGFGPSEETAVETLDRQSAIEAYSRSPIPQIDLADLRPVTSTQA